jgi:hypothetical protein
MIDVSELINDPDFCQPMGILITRKALTWENYRTVETSSYFKATGIIQRATAKDTIQTDSGDRITADIAIWTYEQLQVAKSAGSGATGFNADELTWRGEVYKVQSANDWKENGYYKSLAVRKKGA